VAQNNRIILIIACDVDGAAVSEARRELNCESLRDKGLRTTNE
jgi:hypothetical protein